MTEQQVYDAFPEFMQDYIYDKGWYHLNAMQTEGWEKIRSGESNILFAAGTASGKTEAAFLPAIADIYENPVDSVGILYISPLRALMNDQFRRMEEMLWDTDLRITLWHADASAGKKNRLLEQPKGIMLITPESLEAMLVLHPDKARSLLWRTRYIIIDEIHNLMNGQRGLQMLALLERIQRMTGNIPLRIGLSATIADEQEALAFLNQGTGREGEIISYTDKQREYYLSVSETPVNHEDFPAAYVQEVFRSCHGKRALLFTNSRRECEMLIAEIKKCAEEYGQSDKCLIHHGNISKELREYAENAAKENEDPILIGTTMTLELGIDIGDLDQVVLAAQPMSISSMVQRLGRSGRRSGRSVLSIHLRNNRPPFGRDLGSDMQLVRTIAMVELYFREKYMDGTETQSYPANMLIHEVLSSLCEKGNQQPAVLAENVLELSIFQNVSLEDFAELLRCMADREWITQFEDGAIGLGEAGERIARGRGIYTIFDTTVGYEVTCAGRQIGTVDRSLKQGECFFLAGQSWKVLQVDNRHHRIEVDPEEDVAEIQFSSGGKWITDRRIMDKIHQILGSSQKFGYLNGEAERVLAGIRMAARENHLHQNHYFEEVTGDFMLYPVESTTVIETIYCMLKSYGVDCKRIFLGSLLYGIRIYRCTEEDFEEKLQRICGDGCKIRTEVALKEERPQLKYFSMLPRCLQYKQVCSDYLDIQGARQYLQQYVGRK